MFALEEGIFNVTTPSKYVALHLINTGVVGDITCESTATNNTILTHIFITDGGYTGSLISTGGCRATLYAYNSMSSSSNSIGGANGYVVPYVLTNVYLTQAWTITGTSASTWFNTRFKSSKAHDFSNYTATIRADANSYESFKAYVPTPGSSTFVRVDETPKSVITDATNASVGDKYFANTSGGAIVITLPDSPAQGDEVEAFDPTGDWATANLTMNRNTLKINGEESDYVLDGGATGVKLIYFDAAEGWRTYLYT